MLKKSLLSSLLLLLVFFSCNKGAQDATDSTNSIDANDVATEEVVVVEEEVLLDVVNTYHNLSFYKEPNNGYLGSLSVAEKISTTGLIKKDSKDRDWIEIIRANNERGFVFNHYIIQDSVPAVVTITKTKDIMVFDENSDASMSNLKMSAFRVVAVNTKLVDDTFSKISWNKTDSYNVAREKFILTEDLSFEKDDIEFAKIITAYLSEENRDVKEELLRNAKSLNNISANYRNYLNELGMDDSLPLVPTVNSVLLEYESEVTISDDNTKLELYSNSKKLEKLEDIDFELLSYLLLNVEYKESEILLNIYNTSNFNFTTIPGELSILGENSEYFFGIMDGVKIPSKENISIKFKGKIPKEKLEMLQPEFKVAIKFVNGTKISSHNIVLEKSEDE